MTETMKAAEWLCEQIPPASLPHEVMRLDAKTAAVVIDIGGTDFILTLQRVPKQRTRPAAQ